MVDWTAITLAVRTNGISVVKTVVERTLRITVKTAVKTNVNQL